MNPAPRDSSSRPGKPALRIVFLPQWYGTSTGTTYTSSNPTVVEVSADGEVTGNANGSAILTALNEGKLGIATVTVLSTPLAALEVSPTDAVVGIGGLACGIVT